jgi:DNA-binding SARP family transcriptional activator/class 3 adenylate cyclase
MTTATLTTHPDGVRASLPSTPSVAHGHGEADVVASSPRTMDFRLLGPLEAFSESGPLAVPAGKQGALLAVLLLNANRTLSREQIVDALWGESVPDSAAKMVQIHVSQLRKLLEEPRLHTRGAGYTLEIRGDELDLLRFEQMISDGRRALAQEDAERARLLLGSALALWRGRALAEFSEPFAAHEAPRLEELRLSALEWRIDADLALGHERDVVGELETLVVQHPLRERIRVQHMLALYRSGRHAEALASYQSYRRLLGEDLGMEPSARLRELERMMLRQDTSLEPAGTPPHGGTLLGAPGIETEVGFARSGDVRIAYQVVGEGPIDLVLVNGWVCSFQPGWENPRLAGFYRRLASMGRLILFDKRGTGLSDRVSPERLPDLETRMDDVRAVMDAVGSERAVILGISEGGAMSTLFAASHPERTQALVLMGTFARMMHAPDYPIGLTAEDLRDRLASAEEDDWASSVTKEWLARVGPDILRDPTAVRWYISYIVRGASPAANKAIRLMNTEIDVRDVLPTVSVPTLVLYREEEVFSAATRFMGDHIAGATVVDLRGNDHLPWEGDRDALLDEIERFVAGIHDEGERDRVLSTLLFTDIVDSTAKAAAVGDRAWADLLARHHRLVRAEVARFRGHEIDTAGDGMFASFDGPARAVRCASSIVDAVRPLGIEVRAGVHTGEVERSEDGLRGIAVHLAARIVSVARPGEVLVSSTVKDIVAGSGIGFEERGEHELAGVPGTWRLFSADPSMRAS